jgi:hypothetical protein
MSAGVSSASRRGCVAYTEGLGPQHVPALDVRPHAEAANPRQIVRPEGVDALPGGCLRIRDRVVSFVAGAAGDWNRPSARVLG